MGIFDTIKNALGLGDESTVQNEEETDWENLDVDHDGESSEEPAKLARERLQRMERRREESDSEPREELEYGSRASEHDGDTAQIWHDSGKRLVVRDPRLTPDDEAEEEDSRDATSYDPWLWQAPDPVMTTEEAERLFSETMRTRDEELRTIDTDLGQIARLDLPRWETEKDLADSLELSLDELFYYASHRKADRHFHYVRFSIPKSTGGRRTIMAPKRRLKSIQRDLLRELVDQLPVSDHAHGFRPGRSIKTNAEPHVNSAVVVKLDLEAFFKTVTFPRVRGLFIAYGYGYPVATTLAVLTTEAERQPVEARGETRYVPVSRRYCVQGAPTSPGICNSIASRLDNRLAGLADSIGFRYTRYADDMTFSSETHGGVGTLLRAAEDIVEDEGFRLNDAKTHVMRAGRRQTVTGVVVNEQLGLSRQERRRWRAQIHQMKLAREQGELDPERIDELEGKLAYLEMLNPDQAAPLRAQWEEGGA